MNCMKCGRETLGEDVFCQECLAEMEKYPVEPGTVVLLPRRKDYSPKKAPKRHIPSPEEQIEELRQQKSTMLFLLVVCIILIALMYKPTMHYVQDEHYEIGQNYSSASPSTPENPE